jgi:hypothetical protein
MEFKELEIKEEGSWLRRLFKSAQFRRTIIFAVIGAAGGFLYFYFTEGRIAESISAGEVLKSLLIGGAFGIFVTNSPCARGRC